MSVSGASTRLPIGKCIPDQTSMVTSNFPAAGINLIGREGPMHNRTMLCLTVCGKQEKLSCVAVHEKIVAT